MSTYVLLKFKDNWADEMDIEGFLVATRAYWDTRAAEMRACENELCLCVGTNEELTWANGEDLLGAIEVLELDDDQAALLAQLFPLKGYWLAGVPVIAGLGETGFIDNVGGLES